MRICARCGGECFGRGWDCPSCGFVPENHGDYLAFASQSDANDFVPESFSWLAAAEPGFWWFEARNDIIVWAMQKWCRGMRSFLEVGCGTGFVSARIAQAFPAAEISAAELYCEALPFVRRRLPSAQLYQLNAERLPFREEFDVVGAFDVVEHIERDERVLQEMRRALVRGGTIVLTVPQHPFLWSRFDTYGHHKRRYTRQELTRKLTAAGFRVVEMRSFVSLLMPLQLASRLMPASKEYDPRTEFQIGSVTNGVLRGVMRVETRLIRAGLSLPFGGSLLAVARVA